MRPDTLIADRFVLERPVGAGGMGTVYRAVDRLSGAPVALKLAPLDDAQLRARAIAEADALATLDHAAIVRFVAHGLTPDGRPFLAMEWLDGEDLAQRLERDPLTAPEVALLGERVAGALSFLHARGVVHRDLKPSNLFLPGGEVAQVKLVDFGIVRVPRVAPRLTATGALVGTPAYMAPEQACGEREIAPAADLFALGAVLFECLAGRPAFTGASLMTVLARVLLEEPPGLDAVRTDLPPALVDLVARLLSKQPDERPDAPTVAAALSALLPALEGSVARGGTLAAPAITGDEQRLACVLLIRPAPEQASDAGAPPTGDARAGATLPAERPFAIPPERDALERLLALVRPRGGRADRLADGGLVASWKDPGVPRDQAMRAARAALLARKRLPGAAMALACGMAELHRALPLGPALERAAALLDADEALDDAVPIDDITARLVEARFEIAPAALGHRLIAERAVDEEERRLLLGRAAPCVGRDRELRVLMDLLDECIAEPVARAVLVTAPAGTGKSRLRQELLRFVRQRGDVEVWAASADELAAGSPFVLLGDLLQRAAGAGAGDLIEHRQRRLRELVARHVPEADRARVAAFLGEIAAAPFSAAAYPALAAARREPAIMAEQVRRAFLDLIAAETTARPVLLVFEDLHWGDGPSLQLVDAAIARLSDRPFMVMALARPELHKRFPDLWAGHGAQEMRLFPLTRRAAAQLVRHALPDAGDALVQRLVDRADGHPFSLEELIRAAARGHGDALPETVAAMVQARLAELSSDERRLLRAASAFGEVFWKGGVMALLGGEGATSVAERLDALVAREILVRRKDSRFPGEEELAFRHALLRDGAYAALTDANRALAHRLAAGWLEQAGEADPLILATHYERGEQPGRAAEWYCRTVERALAGNDPHGGIAHAERALALSPDEAVRLQARYAIARATWFAGRLAEAERWIDQVLEATPRGCGVWCAAGHIKIILLVQRSAADLIPFGISMVEGVAATPENAGPLLTLLGSLWMTLGLIGQAQQAQPYYARAEAIVETLGESVDPSSLGHFFFYRATIRQTVVLSLEQALRDAEHAVHLFQMAGDRLQAGMAHASLGFALWNLGAFEQSEAEFRREVEEAAPGVQSGILSRTWLAMLLAHRGALDEGLREATRALTEAHAASDHVTEILARYGRAYVLKRRGAYAAAEQELRGIISLARQTMTLREIYAALAAVRLAQGDTADALTIARGVSDPDARSSATARLQARAVEAEALLATGDRAAARALLAETRAEILAIAADIQDEGLRASFLTRGPLSAPLLQLAEAEGVGPVMA
ncbi:protein kinase domain-containing protein [Sorangium sp. So ce385]|uniref:serine/threonine-protein kinase n=1 Tax=Sorangium sp. So ce385 TaxID=3133308 RepID=UPI003F5C776E